MKIFNIKNVASLLFLVVSFFIIVPSIVFAESNPTPQPTPAQDDYGIYKTAHDAGIPTGQPEPTAIAAALINTVLSIVGIIAVVMIIYGGFLWLTSGGNEEKLTQAKTLLQNVVIGLFIILASYTIANFIVSSLKKATAPTTPSTVLSCAAQGGVCLDGTSCSAGKLSISAVDCLAPSKICCK